MVAADDGIDESQYLPSKASIVNQFRAAKSDLEGRVSASGQIIHAKVKDVSILADLIDRGFLEEFHRWYGLALLELQHAFNSRLRHKVNAIFLQQILGPDVSASQAGKMYDEITRDFKLFRVRIIDRACNVPASEDSACATSVGQNAYRSCFELLVRLVDDARARAKDEREKALANDPRFR